MKNKLILLLLLLTSSFFTRADVSVSSTYKSVPLWCYTDEPILYTIMICAACAAKFTEYNFEHFTTKHGLTVVAYNCDCIFFLRFNRKTGQCEVEFNADDDSFDYARFKRVMDLYFLYAEEKQVVIDR